MCCIVRQQLAVFLALGVHARVQVFGIQHCRFNTRSPSCELNASGLRQLAAVPPERKMQAHEGHQLTKFVKLMSSGSPSMSSDTTASSPDRTARISALAAVKCEHEHTCVKA